MIRQNIKDCYYGFFYWISFILKPIYFLIFRGKKGKKIHLGCGAHYLPGFINMDGNFQRKVDCLIDFRVGLPFAKESVKLIYSCHMLEHLEINDTIKLLKECSRVLEKDGVFRLAVPDFDYIQSILKGDAVDIFPRQFVSPSAMAINYLFCDSQHSYAYTYELINEIYEMCGFKKIVRAKINEQLNGLVLDEPIGSLVVNLYK